MCTKIYRVYGWKTDAKSPNWGWDRGNKEEINKEFSSNKICYVTYFMHRCIIGYKLPKIVR